MNRGEKALCVIVTTACVMCTIMVAYLVSNAPGEYVLLRTGTVSDVDLVDGGGFQSQNKTMVTFEDAQPILLKGHHAIFRTGVKYSIWYRTWGVEFDAVLPSDSVVVLVHWEALA